MKDEKLENVINHSSKDLFSLGNCLGRAKSHAWRVGSGRHQDGNVISTAPCARMDG